MSKKESIVVVCPGRGTYTKAELGYLKQFSQAGHKSFIQSIDGLRNDANEPTVSELDGATRFSAAKHLAGENASALIYACSYLDFLSIDTERYDVVAVLGNSMGWYISLACAGVLSELDAFKVINTMGSLMKDGIIGGQLIYPICDDDWQLDAQKVLAVESAMSSVNDMPGCEVFVSIFLGGYFVLAGNEPGLKALESTLAPVEPQFPMRLNKHAAFHTLMLQGNSDAGFKQLSQSLFNAPRVPLIDGRGHIWQPEATSLKALYEYTFGHQVVKPYDFTTSLTVALKEFAPDKLVLLGPGTTLGGAIGQTLVKNDWLGINSKATFATRQKAEPFLLSMGVPEQRKLVV